MMKVGAWDPQDGSWRLRCFEWKEELEIFRREVGSCGPQDVRWSLRFSGWNSWVLEGQESDRSFSFPGQCRTLKKAGTLPHRRVILTPQQLSFGRETGVLPIQTVQVMECYFLIAHRCSSSYILIIKWCLATCLCVSSILSNFVAFYCGRRTDPESSASTKSGVGCSIKRCDDKKGDTQLWPCIAFLRDDLVIVAILF